MVGSVLKQALLNHPTKGLKRLFTSGVLQLQQVTHFTNGRQSLAKEQERTINLNPKRCYLCQSQISYDIQTDEPDNKKTPFRMTHVARLTRKSLL